MLEKHIKKHVKPCYDMVFGGFHAVHLIWKIYKLNKTFASKTKYLRQMMKIIFIDNLFWEKIKKIHKSRKKNLRQQSKVIFLLRQSPRKIKKKEWVWRKTYFNNHYKFFAKPLDHHVVSLLVMTHFFTRSLREALPRGNPEKQFRFKIFYY